MNLKININNENITMRKEWITLKEASECSIYSKNQIKKLAEKGRQRIRTKPAEDGKHCLYNKIDILQYAAAHPRDIILDTVWDEICSSEGECFYPLYGYDCKYFVSNELKVINCSTGRVLTPVPHIDAKGKETGYMNVGLMKDGKLCTEKLHRLVGITQCPNALGKNIFHHINPSHPYDDRATNLLAVWPWQHKELHKLLRDGELDKYKEMVEAIKKENSQKIYKIPHLDYESNGIFNYYMSLTSDGYKAYIAGKEVPPYCIVGEYAEVKK